MNATLPPGAESSSMADPPRRTKNAAIQKGGGFGESGAVIVDGVLYVNSGYFFQGSTAGNVLLAFTVDGK